MHKISVISLTSQDDGERLLFTSSQNGPGAASRWELMFGILCVSSRSSFLCTDVDGYSWYNIASFFWYMLAFMKFVCVYNWKTKQ